MKKFRNLFIMSVIFSTMLMYACKNNNSSAAVNGEGNFRLDGITYNTPNGYLFDDNSGEVMFQFVETLKYVNDTNNVKRIFKHLAQISIKKTSTSDGTNTYTLNNQFTSNGFTDGTIYLNNDSIQYESNTIGTASITKTGDIYDISYTFDVTYSYNPNKPKSGAIPSKIITGT